VQKTRPSFARLAAMTLFAFSCFALLLFIWKSFGGPSPLAPRQYTFSADFAEAVQLADSADVRISGVKVGRVTTTELQGDSTRAQIEIEPRYAPLPMNTRAILRQKTLLGETFIELTPGDRAKGMLPDGGHLPRDQVQATVELDEVTRALDPATRKDLQRLVHGLAGVANGHAQSLSDSLGELPAFSDDTDQVLTILDEQQGALRRVVRDTGTVLGAVGRRQDQLAGLVTAGDRVLHTTSERNRDLAATVRILPTTLAELRPTMVELRGVAQDAAPVVHELRPAARSLGPTLIDAAALAPDLEGAFRDVDRVVTLSRAAVPALTRVVEHAHPLVRLLPPTLRDALPVVRYLGRYKQEVVSMFTNLGASTQGAQPSEAGGKPLHYIRALVPFTLEGGAVQAKRFGTNRHNPYFRPLAMLKLQKGLESLDCENVGNPGSGEPAPPCKVQKPLLFQGHRTAYPHVDRAR
jgi:phospholipid/cholesterol/gamma-HCH transport system substrate-binding protein